MTKYTPTILQVTAIPLTAARFLLPLATALSAAGYHVEFASGAGPEVTQLEAAGFRVHTVPLQRSVTALANGRAIVALAALMRKQQIQLVHAHTPVAGLLARLAARLAGVPTVFYTLHGTLWGAATAKPPALRTHLFTFAERIGAAATDHIFVLNDRDEAELRRRRLYRAAQITNLRLGGGGVDLRRFAPDAVATTRRTDLRQSWQIPADAPVIGYLGRLVREKGILDLVQAFIAVQQRLPNVHLLLVGGAVTGEWDALDEATIRAAIGDHPHVQQRVHLAGFRDDVPEVLTAMDLVVLPSWREGFGMTLAEAGAMALPVVATRTPGGEQAVVHGETGLLTPISQPQALAEAILTLLTNPALGRAMGTAGRQRALQHFDQTQLISQQIARYQEFLAAVTHG